MAAGLTEPDRRRRWRRRLALGGVGVAVTLAHGWLAESIGELRLTWASQAQMPRRIEVTYVREMALEAPAAPPPTRASRPTRAARSQRVARAMPGPVQAAPPASEPASAPAAELLAERPDAPLASSSMSESGATEAEGEASRLASPPAASAVALDLAESVASPASAAAVASAASGGAAFDWPESTRLSYVLTGHYQGDIHGHAQVEWIRVGSRYQVFLDVTVGLPFAPLLSRRMSSIGEITPEGLRPARYDEVTRLALREPRSLSMRFEADAVVLGSGRRRPAWPGVQDTASQFVQLTWLFGTQPGRLRPGSSVEVPLALPRSVSRWVYDVGDEETLYTRFGNVQAVPLKPRQRAAPGGDMTVEMWFAPQLRYLPARIRIHPDAETHVDLLLARRPELAAR